MENSCHEVFISYSSDDFLIAQAVCHRLEEDDVRCWMAPRDVIAGRPFEGQIVRAIKGCAVMVLIFSPRSNASVHVGNEVAQAFKANKIIIPFIVEETVINDDLDYYLSNKHWLVAYPDYREKTDDLSDTVRRLLKKEPKQEEPNKPSVAPSRPVSTKPSGAEIHIDTDVDCTVYRFGNAVLDAVKGADNVIYLQKGKHRLSFISKQDSSKVYRVDYEVTDIGICDVIEVILEDYYLKGYMCYGEMKYVEAVKWFRKSAEEGNSDAQHDLGDCYFNGYGVIQDYAEAVKWYRKSADQGNVYGQCDLGDCYYYGHGVTQDDAEAVYWYSEAADQGEAVAQNKLGDCYFNGYGVPQDYAEAVNWYREAAEQGDADAQYSLGCCYRDGLGVPKDAAEAEKWIKKSGK